MKNKDIVISMRCQAEKIEKLKAVAREQSYKNEKDITYTDLIREGINKVIAFYEAHHNEK